MTIERESWEKTTPGNLHAAIKFLLDSFDSAHFHFGWPTTQLCYWRLHGGRAKVGTRNIQQYVDTLKELKTRVGPNATRHFADLVSKETPPATFKAFFDLYMNGLKLQIRLIFSGLLQIAQSNSSPIPQCPIEWARALSEDMVRRHRHHIAAWIRDVCDEQPWDPNGDFEEQIFWRKWEAPSFLVMEPSRYGVYDPHRVWERNNPETSAKWLEAFTEDYALILDAELRNSAGMAAFKQATTPTMDKPEKDRQMSQTFNVHGANARINIQSTDNSTNVAHENASFSEVRKVVEAEIADRAERTELLKRLEALEQARDRKSASEKYQAFITAAANHMTILGPYLPMLGHWVHNLAAGL